MCSATSSTTFLRTAVRTPKTLCCRVASCPTASSVNDTVECSAIHCISRLVDHVHCPHKNSQHGSVTSSNTGSHSSQAVLYPYKDKTAVMWNHSPDCGSALCCVAQVPLQQNTSHDANHKESSQLNESIHNMVGGQPSVVMPVIQLRLSTPTCIHLPQHDIICLRYMAWPYK